ncbi:hypothetical protein [Nakamurella endophytica]|uniref:hypothetical protein n=1 Tax=Nakamurella endophytica TaxID=1748367 RepID=UPI00166E621D|nr:hypothetical protein [Nakamurella endophytica]
MALALVLSVTAAHPAGAGPAAPTPLAAARAVPAGAAAAGPVSPARSVRAGGAPATVSPVAGGLTTLLAARTPSSAVSAAAATAAAQGVSASISVVDRSTGRVLAQTGDAGSQRASESVMKLLLASYYLVLYGGYRSTPSDVLSRLSYMLRYSDDATASALFSANAIPTIAARYGLDATGNATDRAGHWGAARITAHDMTIFLFRASRDGAVGPWLLPVMAQTAPSGSDGFDQHFGLNALSGTHGSKQGWGCDSFWTARSCAIHSVGYTDRYFVAVLQLSNSYPDPMRATATNAARLVQGSSTAPAAPPPPAPLRDGDFVHDPRTGGVFVLAGGAPLAVSSWGPFGTPRTARRITTAQWDRLRRIPADGTFLRAAGTGQVFRVAGGAPVYVSSWAPFHREQPAVLVHPAAVAHAGGTGVWAHLRAVVADNTFVSSARDGSVYRIAGGAPLFVSSWGVFGGPRATVALDPAAFAHAGQAGVWNHLRRYPLDGTFLRRPDTGAVFRVAGGAPLYVPSWSVFGGPRPTADVHPAAIVNAGSTAAQWAHLRRYPLPGTFVQGRPGSKIYRILAGVPHYVPSWAPYGGEQFFVPVAQATINRAGSGYPYGNLLR